MKRGIRGIIVAVVLLIGAGAPLSSLLPGVPALAQDNLATESAEDTTGTPPTDTTATGVTTTATTVVAVPPRMTAGELAPFGFWLGVATLLALLVLFFFLGFALTKYYDAARALGALSVNTSPKDTELFQPSTSLLEASRTASGTSQAPALPLTVEGPHVVTVGAESTAFTARLGLATADQARWTVDPATAAALTSPQGPATKLIAAAAGVFTVKATLSGTDDQGKPWNKEAAFPQQVAAVAPTIRTTELPFIGRAYGTLVTIILLLAAVTLLALWGTLEGQAVATFVGGLLGYIFGIRNQVASGGASGTAATGGGAPAMD